MENVELCNRTLGTAKEPTLYGTCIKSLNHPGSCTSPALKEFRRNATAKSRAKHHKVDDSIFYEPHEKQCDHKNCRRPCMFAGIAYPSHRSQEERQQREAAKAAEEAQGTAILIRKAEEMRFLSDVMSRHAAGETIDHQTQATFLAPVISYLGAPPRFSLDRDERVRRGLDIEDRLSEVCYGPYYTTLGEPPSRLDESSFPVRLGRFLGVGDRHGWGNVIYRYHPAHKTQPQAHVQVQT